MAKSLALGSDLCGFARKFLLAAEKGEPALYHTIEQILLELKFLFSAPVQALLTEIKGKWYS